MTWNEPDDNEPGAGPPPPPGYPPPPPPGYPPPPPGYPPPPPPGYPPPYQGGYYQQQGGYGSGSLLAGWWKRVGATLIDGLLIGIPLTIIIYAANIQGTGGNLIEPIVLFVYQTLLISSSRGQTVGNRAASTRVVDANDGSLLTGGRAAVRALVQLVLQFTIIGGILDFLWPLWDGRNQTLHDKAANSLVVLV